MLQQLSWTSKLMRVLLPVVILLAGAGGFFLLASMKRQPAQKEQQDSQTVVVDGVAVRVETVETVPVERHEGPISIRVSGLVVPYREVRVSAEVAGRIESKADACRAGRYVEQGTELVRIDPRQYELARDEAAGTLEELRSQIRNTESLLQIAKSQFVLEKRDYDREQRLRGSVSDADLDQAERELLMAENAVVTLENELRLLKTREKRLVAVLERAQLDLERTVIRAPVSGVVVSDLVEANSFVQPGTALFVMEDTSKVEVKCNLRKEDVQWLWMVHRRQIVPDDVAANYEIPQADAWVLYELLGTTFRWRGRLSRYEGIGLDSKTRTVPCRVTVADPRAVDVAQRVGSAPAVAPPALVRGMYVTVEIEADPPTPLWRIPHRALWPGKVIWLVRDGKLQQLTVRIAEARDETVVVQATAGQLKEDDRVVVSPMAYPADGLPVREAANR